MCTDYDNLALRIRVDIGSLLVIRCRWNQRASVYKKCPYVTILDKIICPLWSFPKSFPGPERQVNPFM